MLIGLAGTGWTSFLKLDDAVGDFQKGAHHSRKRHVVTNFKQNFSRMNILTGLLSL